MEQNIKPSRLSKDIEAAVHAALKAGQYIKNQFRRGFRIQIKEDNSVVTEVDRKAESIIIDILSSKTDHGFLGEESGITKGKSGAAWIIDPIDGTTNYTRGIPVFGVSIGLMHEGESIAGIIYLPMTDELYFAEKGKGAFLNGRKTTVSQVSQMDKSNLCVEHGRNETDILRMASAMSHIMPKWELMLIGSTVVEMAMVACGAADAVILCGDSIWDFAAGLCLIQEAGGRLTDWNGESWDGQTSYLLLSNGHLHSLLLEDLKNLQPDSF